MEALNEPAHRRHEIVEPEDAGALRRALRAAGQQAGLADLLIANAELAATELATNLLRHALPGGYLLWRLLARRRGFELISVDRGPGIADVPRALAGRSREDQQRAASEGRRLESMGMGIGLASVQRLASEFDLFSRHGIGTVVVARITAPPLGSAAGTGPRLLRAAGVSLPIDPAGCGDGWALVVDGEGLTLLLVDGLGHGAKAELAANAAVAVLHGGYDGSLPDYFLRANQAMRATRGGAVSLCRLDPVKRRLSFGGAGNVEGRVFLQQRSYGLMPRPGTLGVSITAPALRLVESDWEPGATLVLCSDGLRLGFDSALCRITSGHDPAVLAALLHRDGQRGRDDASVVVIRDTRPQPDTHPA